MLAGMLAPACASKPDPADLVLRHGKIVTMDRAQPEAAAIAVKSGSIAAVGTDEQIASHIAPSTEVIDLGGRLAIPGFIESHGHFTGLGDSLLQLRLADTKSWEDIVTRVAAAAKSARPGEWIRGRGWHQEKWTSVPSPNVEGFPVHASLDAVSPDNPVVLVHASGHGAYANAKALSGNGNQLTALLRTFVTDPSFALRTLPEVP